uniref:Zn(2)-C6 fungal-type domain-containing protein n=2 Tax=Bionectria ochroleuca TaxID=29856 RepID=A0A0B7KD91_BIOOC
MPGAPRSCGCQTCKDRKIKCDETWPECGNCVRKGVPCPGPTQLLKFIMNQDHSTPQSVLRRAGYLRKGQNAAQASGMQLHPHSSPQSVYKSTSRGPNTGPLRPALVTVDDGVAARLVGHLGTSGKDQMITQTEILRHLPKRMSANQSLRDSVDLLCSVWSSRRSGRAAEEFITMPLYGKAIRSLSRILKTDQAFTMETLAAILIMQRAEALFDPGHRPLIHSKGIATLLARVGAPKKGDKFHASVFAETYSVMIPYWMMTGWDSLLEKPPWRDAVVRGLTEYTGVPELKPYLDTAFDKNNRICEKAPVLIQGILALFKDPEHKEFPATSPFVKQMTEEFRTAETSVREAAYAIFDKAMKLGAIIEEEKPTPLTSTSYNFSSTHLAQSLVSYLSFHIYILRLRCQWNASFQLPDAPDLYKVFQDACIRIWKFVPFMQKAWLFLLRHLQSSLAISFEAANQEEKDYILSIFENLDSHGKKEFRTREELRSQLEQQSLLLQMEWR